MNRLSILISAMALLYKPDGPPAGAGPINHFEVFEGEDKKFAIRHIDTGTVLTPRFKEQLNAEESTDVVNKAARKSAKAMDNMIEKDPDPKRKKILQHVRLLVHGDPNEKKVKEPKYLPKRKDRETYQSAARLSFRPKSNVTEKEKLILEAVERLSKKGRTDIFADTIAEEIGDGWTANMVSGAISVMLQKELIATQRHRPEGSSKIKQQVEIIFPDWRSLVGKEAELKKAKAAERLNKLKAEKAAEAEKDKVEGKNGKPKGEAKSTTTKQPATAKA